MEEGKSVIGSATLGKVKGTNPTQPNPTQT